MANQDDETELIGGLPPSIRDRIMCITYGDIIENIAFFQHNDDTEFMWRVLPILTQVSLEEEDVLYYKGDTAEDFYFIDSGMLKLFIYVGMSASKMPFIRYQQGEMIGDSDALLDLPRDSMAVAMAPVKLQTLNTT